jgi:hypothetical protein
VSNFHANPRPALACPPRSTADVKTGAMAPFLMSRVCSLQGHYDRVLPGSALPAAAAAAPTVYQGVVIQRLECRQLSVSTSPSHSPVVTTTGRSSSSGSCSGEARSSSTPALEAAEAADHVLCTGQQHGASAVGGVMGPRLQQVSLASICSCAARPPAIQHHAMQQCSHSQHLHCPSWQAANSGTALITSQMPALCPVMSRVHPTLHHATLHTAVLCSPTASVQPPCCWLTALLPCSLLLPLHPSFLPGTHPTVPAAAGGGTSSSSGACTPTPWAPCGSGWPTPGCWQQQANSPCAGCKQTPAAHLLHPEAQDDGTSTSAAACHSARASGRPGPALQQQYRLRLL